VITLSQPKAYGEIKPLHDSTGRPVRCTPSQIVVPKVEDRPNCADFQARSCRIGACDWAEESQP